MVLTLKGSVPSGVLCLFKTKRDDANCLVLPKMLNCIDKGRYMTYYYKED